MLALVVMLEANSLELVVTRFIPAMCFCCLLCTVLGSGFTEFNQRNRWSRSHGFCVLGDLRPSHSHLGCGAGGGRVGEIPQDRVGQADSRRQPQPSFLTTCHLPRISSEGVPYWGGVV